MVASQNSHKHAAPARASQDGSSKQQQQNGSVSGSHASTEVYGARSKGAPEYPRYSGAVVDCSYQQPNRNTINTMHRPARDVPSAITRENLDAEHQRDMHAFEKRPPGSTPTLWEQGHIVDRGRRHLPDTGGHPELMVHHGNRVDRRPQTAPQAHALVQADKQLQLNLGSYNPLNNTWVEEANPRYAAQSAPQAHAPVRADKQLQLNQGSYNPVKNTWVEEANPRYAAQRQMEFNRMAGLGLKGRNPNPDKGSLQPNWDIYLSPQQYTSIQEKERAVGGGQGMQSLQERDSGTGRGQRNPGGRLVADGRSSAQCGRETASNFNARTGDRLVSAGGVVGGRGRACHMSGNRWGSYDPINHTWSSPPGNP
eukprot:gene4071-14165_t